MKNTELLDSISPQQIKAVFFDIDGTLVNRNHEISMRSRHAIAQLLKRDITVSLATGRPYFGATQIMSELGVNGSSLFYSGALIINPYQETSLFSKSIEPEVLEGLIQEVSQNNLYFELYTHTDYYISQANQLAKIHSEYINKMPKITSLSELITTEEILKVGFIVEKGSTEEIILYETLAQFSTLQLATAFGASHPHLLWASATHKDAARENAFELLIQSMNISPSEVMAFGDGESDIPFLKLAGVGIAMGNSEKSVQDAARIVTKSVEEDGVFYAISRLLNSR
ncbi:MAG TPA: Cof-type HAD-IIB family hydrolase [Coleofasciculaceae cyanobacterium]